MKKKMTTFAWRGRTYHVPSSWNDLTTEQAEQVYNIVMRDTIVPRDMGDTDVAMRRIMALRYLAGMDDKVWMRALAELVEDHGTEYAAAVLAEEIEEHLSAVDFLFTQREEDGDIVWEVTPGLTRNPHPEIRSAGPTYYGPGDGMANVTIYELGQIFTLYERFVETGDIHLVHELLATMYRPHKPQTADNVAAAYKGDRRLPLRDHEATVPKRTVAMAALPESTRQILLFYIGSCRQAWVDGHPKVFDPVPDPDAVSLPANYGWGGVLLSLADGLAHLDTVADQPAGTALAYLSLLEDRRLAQKEAERRAKAKG